MPPEIQPWLLYELTYRDIHMSHKEFIYATDLPQAFEVGRAFCQKAMPQLKFVIVKAAVVADPRILFPDASSQSEK